MSFALRVRELGKAYRIAVAGQSYRTLREDLLGAPRRLVRRAPSQSIQQFWALSDISFDVQEGEVVGVIGRNGAGKSTLLKVLSRITEPTVGQAELYGRVASLLEVGTGFHPELTGRENVFLSGAILGMRRAEIERRFDEIVAFANVEQFIDTPAKQYSSGMYMRLAFAVAAHLDAEILIVDEVLAVGDTEFQRKSLGKMNDVARSGRTVLFVSHNMAAIRQLCTRALLMQQGRVVADGPVDAVVQRYLQDTNEGVSSEDLAAAIRALPPDPSFRLREVGVTQRGELASVFLNGEPVEVTFVYDVLQREIGLRVYFEVVDREENLLFRSFNDEQGDGIPEVQPGTYRARGVIPGDLLAPTTYDLRLNATIHNVRRCIPAPGIRVPLVIERAGRANRAYLDEPIRGKLAPVLEWTTEPIV